MRTEPAASSERDGPQPKLGRAGVTVNVHVWRLVRLVTVEIEAVGTTPVDRGHVSAGAGFVVSTFLSTSGHRHSGTSQLVVLEHSVYYLDPPTFFMIHLSRSSYGPDPLSQDGLLVFLSDQLQMGNDSRLLLLKSIFGHLKHWR